MQKIKFYMDFLSPFTYFAWVNHQKSIAADRADFEYYPITMGSLFTKHEIKGAGLIPTKRYHSLKHCFRYAHANNIEFTPPLTHPFNPLYCLRMATSFAAGENQKQVIDLFWKLIWAKGMVLEDPDLIVAELNKNHLPGAEILERSYAREAKVAVKQNTKAALGFHAFGSPSFVTEDGELFWGNDSLEFLNEYIKNGDQFDTELFEARTNDINLG
jgi:2-hydroxychromene-2-carboxylate isomerase